MDSRSRSGNLSRLFTDSEMAVDGRIAATLQSAPISGATGMSVGQTYDWMREDMALRSKLAQGLEQEQGMAYNQSARGALAQQAVDQEADDRDALAGMQKIRGLVSKGMDFNQAKGQVVDENPNLYLSDRFHQITKDSEDTFETDRSRRIRDLKQVNEELNLGNEKYTAEALDRFYDEHPEAADEMVRQMDQNLKAKGYTADNALPAARLQAMQTSRGLREAEQVQKQWELNPDNINHDSVAVIKDSMGDLDIADPVRTLQRYNGSKGVAGLLSDSRWRDKYLSTSEEKKKLADALNTENRGDATPEEKRAAQSHVLGLAGKYLRTTADAAKWNTEQDSLKELSKGFQTSYDNVSKELTTMAGSKDAKGSIPMMIEAGRGFVSQGIGTDPVADAVAKEYIGHFDRLAKDPPSKPGEVAAAARKLMANFATKTRAARLEASRDPKEVEAAAKAVGPPSPAGAAVATPKTKAEYDALPAGTPYVDPAGVRGTKK